MRDTEQFHSNLRNLCKAKFCPAQICRKRLCIFSLKIQKNRFLAVINLNYIFRYDIFIIYISKKIQDIPKLTILVKS